MEDDGYGEMAMARLAGWRAGSLYPADTRTGLRRPLPTKTVKRVQVPWLSEICAGWANHNLAPKPLSLIVVAAIGFGGVTFSLCFFLNFIYLLSFYF